MGLTISQHPLALGAVYKLHLSLEMHNVLVKKHEHQPIFLKNQNTCLVWQSFQIDLKARFSHKTWAGTLRHFLSDK